MSEATIQPTWGYRPDGSAQIFDLGSGEALPDGWHPSPTVITDPARATAEAREEVRALLGQGFTDREIDRRAGVSPSTVGNIRKGQP